MTDRKRICFFSGDITRSGGTEKVSAQIMNALCDDYDVFVVSLTEEAEKPFYAINDSVARASLFESSPDGMTRYFAIVRRLRRFLRAKRIDLLIDIDTVLDIFSVPAVRGLGVKLAAWEHFSFYETMGTRIRMPIRKHFTRKVDAVVTLTREDKDYFTRAFRGQTRVVQIYNPIIFPRISAEYDDHSKTIVSIGRLAKQKGVDYLIETAETVFARHPDWEWLILGEGEERQTLEAMLAERQLRQVRLIGRVANVEDYLSESAIFVLTSRYEGFPLALVEAKAMGLPAVSFRCRTGPSELIEDGVNGFLIDCFHVEQMAEKICELIEDSGKRIAFSQRALDDTDRMNYSYIVSQWKSLLDDLLSDVSR